jgi:enoyl-CoA hydratase/carnithine racemase
MMRITLSNKNKENVIDAEMLDGLLDALVELHKSASSQVRLLEVRAEGGAFCNGLDPQLANDDEQVQRMLFLFNMLPMPVLGIIQGRVSGFGLALCSTFDMIWADAQHAAFSFDSLALQNSGLYVVNRFRSSAVVEEMVAKRTTLSAKQAYDNIFITSVFGDLQELELMIRELCEKVSLTGPNGVSQQKPFIHMFSSVPTQLGLLHSLCGHVASRMVDPEFNDSLEGIGNSKHQPRFCQNDMLVKPFNSSK